MDQGLRFKKHATTWEVVEWLEGKWMCLPKLRPYFAAASNPIDLFIIE